MTPHQKIINELKGLSLHPVVAAADMLCIHFGTLKSVLGKNGEQKEVGQWAIHLQCPWRFIQRNRVILASSDFYYDAVSGEPLDSNSDRPSVFQRNKEKLNVWVATTKVAVSSVTCGKAGAFDLRFGRDLELMVMPSQSEEIMEEAWRLFQPGSDKPHIVFPLVA